MFWWRRRDIGQQSVGQEGLNFHAYCHAVVHWNLPGNPVDLEQRAGRVHRYKGHAVRRNVVADHRAAAFGDNADPWTSVFDAAAGKRVEDDSELVPTGCTRGRVVRGSSATCRGCR